MLLGQDEDKDMDVDVTSIGGQAPTTKISFIPEVEIYAYLLTLIFLIDQKQYDAVSFIPPGVQL